MGDRMILKHLYVLDAPVGVRVYLYFGTQFVSRYMGTLSQWANSRIRSGYYVTAKYDSLMRLRKCMTLSDDLFPWCIE